MTNVSPMALPNRNGSSQSSFVGYPFGIYPGPPIMIYGNLGRIHSFTSPLVICRVRPGSPGSRESTVTAVNDVHRALVVVINNQFVM